MTNLLLIIVVLSSLVAACKYRPNQVRSSLQSKNIYQFVEEGSVRFYRNADASKADLQFNLLNHYECIVSFWSDDINVEPNEDAPKYQSCVKGDQSIRMSFDELNPEATYAVKISIWPARLSSLTSANLILREGEDLKDVNSNNLIIANFLTPRQTGEIYSFGFQGQKSLQDVRNEIITSYAGKLGCSDKRTVRPLPFDRSRSTAASTNASAAGITAIGSDGYGVGEARTHKFFADRFVHNFETVDAGQDISWFLEWQKKKFNFRTPAPVKVNRLTITTDRNRYLIDHRSLKGVPPDVEGGDRSPRLAVEYLYPGDLNYIHFAINSQENPQAGIFCTFAADQSIYTIDSELYNKLSAGDYALTATIEAIQLHYESPPRYPPWVISHQDWVHSRFTKVL